MAAEASDERGTQAVAGVQLQRAEQRQPLFSESLADAALAPVNLVESDANSDADSEDLGESSSEQEEDSESSDVDATDDEDEDKEVNQEDDDDDDDDESDDSDQSGDEDSLETYLSALTGMIQEAESSTGMPSIPGHTTSTSKPEGHKEVKTVNGSTKSACKKMCDADSMCAGFKFITKPKGKSESECSTLETMSEKEAEEDKAEPMSEEELAELEAKCKAEPSPECEAKLKKEKAKAAAHAEQELANAAKSKDPAAKAAAKIAGQAAKAVKAQMARRPTMAQMKALMKSKIGSRKREMQALRKSMPSRGKVDMEVARQMRKLKRRGKRTLAQRLAAQKRMDRIKFGMVKKEEKRQAAVGRLKQKMMLEKLRSAKAEDEANKLKATAALMKIEEMKLKGTKPMTDSELAALAVQCEENPSPQCSAKLKMARKHAAHAAQQAQMKRDKSKLKKQTMDEKMADVKAALAKKFASKLAREKRHEARKVARAQLQGTMASLSSNEAKSKGGLKDEVSVEALRKELLYQRKKEMTLKEQIKTELGKRNKEALVKSKLAGMEKLKGMASSDGIPPGELKRKYEGYKDAYTDLVSKARDKSIKGGQFKQKVNALKNKGDLSPKDKEDMSFYSDQADGADKDAAKLNKAAAGEKEKAQSIRDQVKANEAKNPAR